MVQVSKTLNVRYQESVTITPIGTTVGEFAQCLQLRLSIGCHDGLKIKYHEKVTRFRIKAATCAEAMRGHFKVTEGGL